MSRPTRITLFDLVKDLGLKLEYVDDLPANVYGQLDPRPEPLFIAVKRGLPSCEETFTIAHELGHYVMHPSFRPRREHSTWFTTRKWTSPVPARIAILTRRYSRRRLNAEWDADVWALACLLQLGDVQNLNAFLKLHPEKTGLFLFTTAVSSCNAIPRLITGIFRGLLRPFGISAS